MRTQPTSGPWRAKAIGSFNEPGYAVFWEDRSKSGVHTRRLDYKGCFTEADARLIAVAPDMYEALKSIVEDHDFCGDDRGDRRDAWIETARASLTKAEGKS